MENRTIKFRGKRLDNGKWVYGSLLQGESQSVIAAVEGNSLNVHDCFEVVPEAVGQFTGMLDRNGKEIYEGDILQSPSGNTVVVKFGYKEHIVKHEIFTDSFAAYGWIVENVENGITDFLDNEFLKGEIVGNRFDNPDLLNGK